MILSNSFESFNTLNEYWTRICKLLSEDIDERVSHHEMIWDSVSLKVNIYFDNMKYGTIRAVISTTTEHISIYLQRYDKATYDFIVKAPCKDVQKITSELEQYIGTN